MDYSRPAGRYAEAYPSGDSYLTEIGVNAIVSVMDAPSNLDLYEQVGLPYRWLPTTGGKAPTLEQIEEFVQFVEDQNAQSHSVVVHCSSGRRRTGTFLAAYLIKSGQSVEQALATIDQSNPLVELREAQIRFLKTLGV